MAAPAGMDPRVAAKIAPPALAPGIIDPKPEWRINLDHWLVNEGAKVRQARCACGAPGRIGAADTAPDPICWTGRNRPGSVFAAVDGHPGGSVLHDVRAVPV